MFDGTGWDGPLKQGKGRGEITHTHTVKGDVIRRPEDATDRNELF